MNKIINKTQQIIKIGKLLKNLISSSTSSVITFSLFGDIVSPSLASRETKTFIEIVGKSTFLSKYRTSKSQFNSVKIS